MTKIATSGSASVSIPKCHGSTTLNVMKIYSIDEGGLGTFPDWGPLAEDSATKLKRGQINVCPVYGVLFSYRG
jgi:hypothetical protein